MAWVNEIDFGTLPQAAALRRPPDQSADTTVDDGLALLKQCFNNPSTAGPDTVSSGVELLLRDVASGGDDGIRSVAAAVLEPWHGGHGAPHHHHRSKSPTQSSLGAPSTSLSARARAFVELVLIMKRLKSLPLSTLEQEYTTPSSTCRSDDVLKAPAVSTTAAHRAPADDDDDGDGSDDDDGDSKALVLRKQVLLTALLRRHLIALLPTLESAAASTPALLLTKCAVMHSKERVPFVIAYAPTPVLAAGFASDGNPTSSSQGNDVTSVVMPSQEELRNTACTQEVSAVSKVLVKADEDVTQEYVMMQVLMWMNSVWAREGVSIDLSPWRVETTHSSKGPEAAEKKDKKDKKDKKERQKVTSGALMGALFGGPKDKRSKKEKEKEKEREKKERHRKRRESIGPTSAKPSRGQSPNEPHIDQDWDPSAETATGALAAHPADLAASTRSAPPAGNIADHRPSWTDVTAAPKTLQAVTYDIVPMALPLPPRDGGVDGSVPASDAEGPLRCSLVSFVPGALSVHEIRRHLAEDYLRFKYVRASRHRDQRSKRPSIDELNCDGMIPMPQVTSATAAVEKDQVEVEATKAKRRSVSITRDGQQLLSDTEGQPVDAHVDPVSLAACRATSSFGFLEPHRAMTRFWSTATYGRHDLDLSKDDGANDDEPSDGETTAAGTTAVTSAAVTPAAAPLLSASGLPPLPATVEDAKTVEERARRRQNRVRRAAEAASPLTVLARLTPQQKRHVWRQVDMKYSDVVLGRHIRSDPQRCAAFVSTLTASCVAAAVLRLKDRHNANFLISPATGTLANVDFGFCLGQKPGGAFGYETALFTMPPPVFETFFDSSTKSPMFSAFTGAFTSALGALQRHWVELAWVVLHLPAYAVADMPCYTGDKLHRSDPSAAPSLTSAPLSRDERKSIDAWRRAAHLTDSPAPGQSSLCGELRKRMGAAIAFLQRSPSLTESSGAHSTDSTDDASLLSTCAALRDGLHAKTWLLSALGEAVFEEPDMTSGDVKAAMKHSGAGKYDQYQWRANGIW